MFFLLGEETGAWSFASLSVYLQNQEESCFTVSTNQLPSSGLLCKTILFKLTILRSYATLFFYTVKETRGDRSWANNVSFIFSLWCSLRCTAFSISQKRSTCCLPPFSQLLDRKNDILFDGASWQSTSRFRHGDS